MNLYGCVASVFHARARYRMLPALAAFCMACASAVSAAGLSAGAEIVRGLRDPRPEVREQALQALTDGDPAVLVRQILETGRLPASKGRAANIVRKMGPRAIGPLFALLPDEKLGSAAGGLLFAMLTSEHPDRLPALLDCARNQPAVKNYCIQSLVRVAGPRAAAHAPALGAALASPDPLLRAYAAAALGAIGKGASAQAPALRAALKDPDAEVRRQARAALRRAGA